MMKGLGMDSLFAIHGRTCLRGPSALAAIAGHSSGDIAQHATHRANRKEGASMLVLSRKPGEKVVIVANEPIPAGTEIHVVLPDVNQYPEFRRVRLGLVADRRFDIHRADCRPDDVGEDAVAC